MDNRREERLEPLVLAAIEAKRCMPRPVRPRSQETSLEKRYVEGARNDIEDMAAIRPTDAIVAQLKLRFPGATGQDIQDAIAAANALQQWGLLVESGFGDNEGAVTELETKVPGFSYELYKNVIAYFGYINH